MPIGTRLDADPHELLSRAQSGDTSAFEKLVERHRDNLYGFSLRMTRSETEALEIAQESFLSAYLHLGQFRNEKDCSAWLRRTAASHALLRLGCGGTAPVAEEKREEELRVSKFHPTGVPEHSPRPDWSSNADQPRLSAKLRRAIEDAVDHLPQSHRQAFLLKDVAGLSYEEIAHLTAQSIPAIKDRVHRARLSLRETIDCFYRES